MHGNRGREATPTAKRADPAVVRYHERTKHYPERYARSLGYLDWLNQPDPFRRYMDASLIRLEELPPRPEHELGFDKLFAPESIEPRPVNLTTISQLFYDSLALSAWKAAGGSRWPLRVNPSSGNLHPTEGYLISGPVEGLTNQACLYHYAPQEHALEVRMQISPEQWIALSCDLPSGTFFIGFSSIYWRESWKYGERAFRYCQHDAGHAIAAATIAARVLGWQASLLERPTDACIAMLLGIDRQQGIEAEHPDCLLAVSPHSAIDREIALTWKVPENIMQAASSRQLAGTANRLSESHQHWEEIDKVSDATIKRELPDDLFALKAREVVAPRSTSNCRHTARAIIRRRRSALAMDECTEIEREVFYRMLLSVVPAANPIIFQVLPWRPCVHLAIFVHRVRNLLPGLYLLVREPAAEALLRKAVAGKFCWDKAEGSAPELHLYRLQPGDFREQARLVSCHQEIAGDGAFSLGMLAEFETTLTDCGAWFYKRLFWETGVIGQVLYLDAEASAVRATGIGCFFDDLMHRILGIGDRRLQSLYHFTVGGPVEDPRLRTEPAYAHLHCKGQD